MKAKIFTTVLFLLTLLQFSTAQFQISEELSNLLKSRKVSLGNHYPVNNTQSGSRSSTYNVYLDYDMLDEMYATNIVGSDYQRYIWELNNYYPNESEFTLRTAAVVFDSLFYTPNQIDAFYHPRASSTVRIDSLGIAFTHDNLTTNSDSIFITIFDADNYAISGSGTTGTLSTPSIWDTLIVTNTSLAPSQTNPLFLFTYPALQLNTGQLFGVRVDFRGDTANKFTVVAGGRDDCFGVCLFNRTIAGNHSNFYLNLISQGTNFSGFTPPSWDCNQNGYTPGECEDFYIQNLMFYPCLTVVADTIIPVVLSYLPPSVNRVSGNVYRDINQNGVFDTSDAVITNKLVAFNNYYSFISSQSGYQGRVSDGTYSVIPPVIANYNLTTHPANFLLSLSQNMDTVINFGYVPVGISDSVSVTGAVSTNICSSVSQLWATVYNEGTFEQNVRVTIFIDSTITFLSATGSVSMQAHSATWQINPLQPLTHQQLVASIQIPNFQFMGNTVNYTVLVERYEPGDWINADTYEFNDIVRCSYDPNDKRVFPQGEVYQDLTLMNTELHYTVRFQNTGNFPATTVEIRDTLDTNLDYSTFKLLGSSHSVQANIEGERFVSFMFENINLPDSLSNEPGSHGYVSYSVKPLAGLSSGTSVENTAHIYFDFNPAVVTNTTNTEYVNQFPTGITRVLDDGFIRAMPNPFSESTLLSWPESGKSSIIKVYDLRGALMLSEKTSANTFVLNKNSLAKGMYLVKVVADRSYSVKMVVE